MRLKIGIISVLTLSGCASVQNPFTTDKTFAGISPPAMHRRDDAGRQKMRMVGLTEIQITGAESKPFVDYYNALKAAAEVADGPAKQTVIDDYVLKGITLVNVSCSRWFNSLAESQARLAFMQNNQNVIQNLGTTLLGFAKANSNIVGTYGAGFAALNGIQDNFSQSFLLAPNANKVKEHIFTALDQQASELRTPNDSALRKSSQRKMALRPTTFTEAYMSLEKYADICTQQTSKEIVNSALDQTTTQIQSDRGNKIITASTQDAALTKVSADMIALQKETAQSIAVLQESLKTAKTKSDYQSVKNRVDEIARTLRNPPVSSNIVSPPVISVPLSPPATPSSIPVPPSQPALPPGTSLPSSGSPSPGTNGAPGAETALPRTEAAQPPAEATPAPGNDGPARSGDDIRRQQRPD